MVKEGVKERLGSRGMSPAEQRVGEKGVEKEERIFKRNTVFYSRYIKLEA